MSKNDQNTLFNVNSILSDLTCSVCLEYFKDPKTLTCQHSFCNECLKPLLNVAQIQCPQCRSITQCRDLNAIPRNALLANLVINLQGSVKAACPQCKSITILVICEHCSQVFCKLCKNSHIRSVVENLEKKCKNLESLPKKLDDLRLNLKKAEQESLSETIKQLNQVEIEVLSILQSRKLSLIEQINRFYLTKSKEINKSCESMKRFENGLKNAQKELTNCNDQMKFQLFCNEKQNDTLKNLVDLEKKMNELEANFNETLPKINIETNKLKLVCEKVNNFDLYVNMIEKIHLETTNEDKDLLENSRKNDTLEKYEIKCDTLFGKEFKLEFDTSQVKLADMKEKFMFQTGIGANNKISFMDKQHLKLINQEEVLRAHKNVKYNKRSSSKSSASGLNWDGSTEKSSATNNPELFVLFGDLKNKTNTK